MLLIISAGTDGKSKAATLQMGDKWKTKPERSKFKACNYRWWAYKQNMKKCLLLLLLACFAVPCLAQSTNDAVSSESAQVQAWSQLLLLVGQALLVVVAVLVALAWIWFPFMVKGRLDKIIRRLESMEQLLSKKDVTPPDSR